jgi:uncharacterized phage protein (TIGR01671 family)
MQKREISMNRQIIFRGKRKDTGGWVCGYYVVADGEHVIFTGKTGLSQVTPVHHLMYKDFVRYEVIPETIGQYTGIMDNAGLKVFEGDIVSWEGHGIIDNGELQRAKICFDETELAYIADTGGGNEWFLAEIQDDIEVIGNFYDTPELLGRK